jgi:signal peptidase II
MALLPALPPRSTVTGNIARALIALGVIVAVDQFTKWLVVEYMNLKEIGAIDVIPFFNFRMAWNTGVNFGLLSAEDPTGRALLIAFTGGISLALVVASMWSRRPLSALGLGIAAGGAIGNLIDRFTYGAVADFINMSGFGIRNPWSFNVADIAIFAGFALLLWPTKKPAEVQGDPSRS